MQFLEISGHSRPRAVVMGKADIGQIWRPQKSSLRKKSPRPSDAGISIDAVRPGVYFNTIAVNGWT
jgi:hypothetical protein